MSGGLKGPVQMLFKKCDVPLLEPPLPPHLDTLEFAASGQKIDSVRAHIKLLSSLPAIVQGIVELSFHHFQLLQAGLVQHLNMKDHSVPANWESIPRMYLINT